MFDIKMESIPGAPMTPGQWKSSGAASDPAERLTALGQMTHTELRDEWRRLFRAHPPKKISRDLLELAVAWKLQEKALGGLGVTIRRKVGNLGQKMDSKGNLALSEAQARREADPRVAWRDTRCAGAR